MAGIPAVLTDPWRFAGDDEGRAWDGADEEASEASLPTWPACPDTQRGRTVGEIAD